MKPFRILFQRLLIVFMVGCFTLAFGCIIVLLGMLTGCESSGSTEDRAACEEWCRQAEAEYVNTTTIYGSLRCTCALHARDLVRLPVEADDR